MEGRAAYTAGPFEAAAAEERVRSAEAAAEEEQERVAGEQAMARVEINSTFLYRDQVVVVKRQDPSGNNSFKCKRPGIQAHESFEAAWILGRQAKMASGAALSCDDSEESVVGDEAGDEDEAKAKGGKRRSARLGGFCSPGRAAAIAALGQSVSALGLGRSPAGVDVRSMAAAVRARCEEEEGGARQRHDSGSDYSEGSGGGEQPTPKRAALAEALLRRPLRQAAKNELLSFLEGHNLASAEASLRELGAEAAGDLLDLDDGDIAGLGLKKLELKRFARAVAALQGVPQRQPMAMSDAGGGSTPGPESIAARRARERRNADQRVGVATALGLRRPRAADVAVRAPGVAGAAAVVAVRSVTDQEFVNDPAAHIAAARARLEPTDATNLGKSDSDRLLRVLVGVPEGLVNGAAVVRAIQRRLMTTEGLEVSLRPKEDLLVAVATTQPPFLGLGLEYFAAVRADSSGGPVSGVAVVEERLFAKQTNVTRKFSFAPVASAKVTAASLHYAVEVWEAVMAVAAPFVAGKLRSLHRVVLIEDRARCAGVPGKGGAQAPAVEAALLALNAHIKAWAANLEAAAVMSAVEEAGFLTAGVFDATSAFHKMVAAPAAPPRTAAPPGGF